MRHHPLHPDGDRGTLGIPAAALLAAAALSLAGCVSNTRFAEVEHERDLLAASNEALKGQVENANRAGDSLEQEKVALAQEKSSLAAAKAELEQRLAELQSKDDALGSQLRDHEQESQRLKATYDGLVSDLKKEVQAGQVQVQQLRDGLRVNVAQDILFDSGSAALDKRGTEVLTRVAVQLKKSSHQIMVIGHTDNKPIRQELARKRSEE